MEPISFMMGGLMVIPFFIGALGAGVAFFFLSPYTKDIRDKLIKSIENTQEQPREINVTPQPEALQTHEVQHLPEQTITSNTMANIGADFFQTSPNKESVQKAEFKQEVLRLECAHGNEFPIWVKVRFSGDAYGNEYSYFLGDITGLRVGDEVIVYARQNKKSRPKRRRAIVTYISEKYEQPPERTRSPISLKVRGAYMASKRGSKYHVPTCKEMENVSDSEAIWFKGEDVAIEAGYQPCQKCDP